MEFSDFVSATSGDFTSADEDEGGDLDSYGDPDSSENETEEQKASHKTSGGKNLNLLKEVDKFIVLRTNLEHLEEEQAKKILEVQHIREELLSSKNRSEVFEQDYAQNEEELKEAKKQNNTARIGYLTSQQNRIKIEIEEELKLQLEIDRDLEKGELDQLRSDLNYQQMLDLADQVRQQEVMILDEKDKMASARAKKLHEQEKLAENKWKKREKEMKKKERREKEMREKTYRNMADATARNKQFVQQTAFDLKAKRLENEKRIEELTSKKMNDVIKLKNKIDEGRENIKAIQAKKQALARQKAKKEEAETQRILKESGGNPTVLLMERKLKEKYKKEAREFEKKQQENRTKVIERMLNEESNFQKRKKLYPYLFTDTRHKSDGDPKKKPKQQSYLDQKLENLHFDESGEPQFQRRHAKSPRQNDTSLMQQYERGRGYSSTSSSESDNDDMMEVSHEITESSSSSSLVAHNKPHITQLNYQETSLARPEFEGIWAEDHEPYKVTVESVEEKPLGGSKLEKEIMKRNLETQRKKVFRKQVAGGREFKGQPFVSKPDVIHFKDLDVGETYKKKIQITNVSYTINFCKFIDISHHLKDFITIQFSPPGAMSAGMTCELNVTFKPMINSNLEGELFFQAQTGNFTIPIKCTVKKCELSVDLNEVDFGKEVIGEKTVKTITLRNNGALATKYRFYRVSRHLSTEDAICKCISSSHDTFEEVISSTENDSQEDKMTENNSNKSCENDDGKPPNSPEGHKSSGKVTYATTTSETKTASEAASSGEVDEIEIQVGEKSEGTIEAFSSTRLHLIFTPTIPGVIDSVFRIEFEKNQDQNININVRGVGVDIPVWLERKEIDLKICIFNRLYQDQIIVKNRAKYALKLTFEVPKQLKNHIELLPKTGYIQSKSSFTAQLKFLPRSNLAEDAGDLFDADLGVLQAPMTIKVAGQSRPVQFVVNAIVTSSNMHFDQKLIDFGNCNIYEEVTHPITLTNESLLPQNFGFIDVPEFMDIQPNDGFGKILPRETLELDLIMRANKAKNYDVTLTCKSEINRSFEIRCRAVGVHPPLCLSHQIIKFAATALYDVRSEVVDVINAHTDANEFTHPVPRIGKEKIAPVGATSFEFQLPSEAPFNIYPLVGTVEPGEKCQVTVEFAPSFSPDQIKCEAVEKIKIKQVKLQQKLNERKQEQKRIEAEIQKTRKKSKTSFECSEESEEIDAAVIADLPQPEDIQENSDEYIAAITSLMQKFESNFATFSVSCLISSGKCSVGKQEGLPYNPANVIYLQVSCPVIRPPIMIISNGGKRKIEFGQISIGLSTIGMISILNISDNPVQLKSSLLDVCGPFNVVNASRPILPGETHSMKVSFSPKSGQIFQETLKIHCELSTIELSLIGEGVTPLVKLDPDLTEYQFDDVVYGEKESKSFTMINESSLSVDFDVVMDSAQSARKSAKFQGMRNSNGSDVFECYPCSGSIKPGESCELAVSFHPDHPSLYFGDKMKIFLFGNQLEHEVRLRGRSHPHMIFVTGHDPLDVAGESFQPSKPDTSEDSTPVVCESMLLTFVSRSENNQLQASQRILKIGCIKSVRFASKKSVDVTIENFQEAQQKGFSFESNKFSVESGSEKTLTITWTPNPNVVAAVTSSCNLLIKGDVTMNYDVTLSGSFRFE